MDTCAVNRRTALWFDPVANRETERLDAIARAGWDLVRVESIESIESLVAQATRPDAIVLRLVDDPTLLTDCLERLPSIASTIPLICRVGPERLDLAAIAGRIGATHVLADGDLTLESWTEAARRIASRDPARASTRARPAWRAAVFVDPASRHLLALARRVARAEVTTLLTGPTGAGKEILARVLHESSPRAGAPFVAFNCAALPEQLVEDMLFGHEKGAFTGAHREHRGLFEQAHGGTLFLDEIGEMPTALQSKLLRVLQERVVTRLGGSAAIALDFRLVAATSRDLKTAIREKAFREDLFYRIATFQLRLMPLADRRGDILPLADACLQRLSEGSETRWRLSDDACERLLAHRWPGNVRELENVVQRAVVLSPGPIVTAEHLLFDDTDEPIMASPQAPRVDGGFGSLSSAAAGQPTRPQDSATAPHSPASAHSAASAHPAASDPRQTPVPDLSRSVRESELRIIRAAIAACDNREEAARRLGISPRTLRYKLAQMREHGLDTSQA